MLSILLFGAPELRLGDHSLPLQRRKNRALVYYLAAQPEPVRRERLLLLLWPDLDRPAAQHSLRTLLHGLRQTLGSTLLVTDETLALAPDTEVDVRRLAAGLAQPPGEPHALEAALTLYRGEFLADFSLPDSPAFDDWVVAERERYRQLAIHGLTMLAQLQAARRVWPAALAAITRAVDLDPLREDVQAIAMQLQYFAGDRTGAIRRYEQLRKLLDDELGLPPMAETRAVYDAIITERLPPPMIAPAPAAPEVDAPQPAEPEVLRPTPPPDVALSPGVSAQPQPVVPGAPILATKLFLPPARAALVPRPRLHARLDRGLAGPLTIIAAPAGFGKTTLLAEWLAQLPAGTSIPSGSNATACPPQVAWLSLDAGDSDPIQFLRYLIAALQTVAPTVGSRVLSLLDSAQAPRIESLIPLVINELAALPDPTILVLDDYHVVDAPAVHQALTFLIDHLPPQLHLILATRSDPPLPLARLRARRQLTELRAQDLRFAPEEAEQFLREVMGLALSAADVAALETRTEGWIAGLQLAALFLQDRPREQIAHFIDAFTGSHRFVVDYLVDEVLARQPAHLQTFLLRTSILDRLSGDLCDALVHGDESRGGAGDRRAPAPGASQAVLENLERGNLFIVPLDDTRHWYRYHHLFAQVLRERLQRSVSVDELASLHRRAATWFEGQGFVVETVHHAMAARDWEHAARLIEAHGQLLILRGQVSTVLNWLTILAKPLLRARPHLLFLQGLGLFFVNQMEDAWVHMQAVREALAREPDERSRTIRGYATVNLAANAHFRGDFTTCITLAREALEILPAPDVTGRNSSNVHMASALSLSGDVTPANERRIIGGIATARQLDERVTIFNGLTILADLQRRQGRLRQAAATYREAAQVVSDPEALHAMLNSATYYFGLGELLREWNDLDAADALLVQGQALVRRKLTASVDAIVAGYVALARLRQARADRAEAGRILDELEALAGAGNFPTRLQARSGAVRAHLALIQGDLAEAEQWADRSALSPNDNLSYLHEREYLTLAHVGIARGQTTSSSDYFQGALHLLDRLLDQAEEEGRIGSAIEILILQSLARHTVGDLDRALGVLHQALTLAASEGYIRVFVDEGATMATLLAHGVETWGMADGGRRTAPAVPLAHVRQYAEQLLDVFRTEGVVPQRGLNPPTPTPDPPSASSHGLTERELEVLRLLAAGHSNRAIAEQLIVAVGTVKRHVSNIMAKMEAESRLEVVARARDLGLI